MNKKINAEIFEQVQPSLLCYMQVTGYYFNKHGVVGVIHKSYEKPDYWSLTHLKSGLKIVRAKRKKDIETELLNRIQDIGSNYFYEAMQKVPCLTTLKQRSTWAGSTIISLHEYQRI